jgi:hypothetical protein
MRKLDAAYRRTDRGIKPTLASRPDSAEQESDACGDQNGLEWLISQLRIHVVTQVSYPRRPFIEILTSSVSNSICTIDSDLFGSIADFVNVLGDRRGSFTQLAGVISSSRIGRHRHILQIDNRATRICAAV